MEIGTVVFCVMYKFGKVTIPDSVTVLDTELLHGMRNFEKLQF